MSVVVTDQITRSFVDNRSRYDGRASGYYEVWFLTLNDPITGCGFWFRYALDVPIGRIEGNCSLWGSFFDPRTNRCFGIKQEFPANRWRNSNQTEGLIIGVDDYALLIDRLNGRLTSPEHQLSWQLAFQPAAETFHHIDDRVRRWFKPKTEICAPNLAIRFTGTIEVDGQSYFLEHAPGGQQHIWGSKHAESWSWVHCNKFIETEDAVFEGLAACPRVGPITPPPLTLAYLRYRGQQFCFNRISNFVRARNQASDFAWQFQAGDGYTRILGEASGLPERMVQVEYPDPDGERTFCVNSEIGDLSLTVEQRQSRFSSWQLVTRLTSRGFAHFERASRERQPAVGMIFG